MSDESDGVRLVFRHKKRGSTYVVQGVAKVQSSTPLTDGCEVVVYAGPDGQLWVRPVGEFYDGRFEPVGS